MINSTDNYIIERGGIIRVDGVVIGRLVLEGERILLQVKDRLKPRAIDRGSEFVYLDLLSFLEDVKENA